MAWLVRLWTRFIHWLGFSSSDFTSGIPNLVQSTPSPISEPELDLGTEEAPKYKQSDSVFTYQERRFFRALRDATGKKYEIFPKVRLGDFVYLSNLPKNQKYHRNQIQCKHIDYLLCEKFRFKPILAIELDDSSHNRLSRIESDEFKSTLFEEIGLPLLRFKIQSDYNSAEIVEKIEWRLQRSTDDSKYP